MPMLCAREALLAKKKTFSVLSFVTHGCSLLAWLPSDKIRPVTSFHCTEHPQFVAVPLLPLFT